MEGENRPEFQIIRARETHQLQPYYSSPHNKSPEESFYPDTIYPESMEQQMGFLDCWRIIVKRWWIVFLLVSVSLAVTVIVTWSAIPVYRATTRIQIDPESQNVLPFQDVNNLGVGYAQSREYLETQFRVLESRELAERVIHNLDLGQNPAFTGSEKPSWRARITGWGKKALGLGENQNELSEAEREEVRRLALIDTFLSRLTITPVRNSRLVDASFDSTDPKLAAAVAASLATQYIQMNFDTKYNATNAAADFMSEKIVDMKIRVEKSEGALTEFGQQHNIYAIRDNDNVTMRKLADLNSALTTALTERLQKESVWNVVQKTASGNYPDILKNDLIRSLEKDVSALKQRKMNLDAEYYPTWPELNQVVSQLYEAERQLDQEKQRALRNAETEYQTALQREMLLTREMEEHKKQVDELNRDLIHYNILQRQVETDRELYDGLLQRMKEAGVSAGLQSSNIHVVDVAQTPRFPYTPKKTRNLAVGLGIGLLLGAGLAFFIERLDNSLKTPDDIDRFLSLPSLGVIPSLDSAEPKRKLLLREKQVETVVHTNVMSLISESYRNLRVSVTLSSGTEAPPRVLLLTSSHAGEGKTTTAINLAITLAQTGARVVLLDCDLRRPRIHRIIGRDNNEGLRQYLSGKADLDAVVKVSEIPNLSIITAGPLYPNPTELLGSPRMKEGLAWLAGEYDYVVIDSSPVLAVSDARILATMVDGVILVVKGGVTPKEVVQHAKRLIEDVHGRLLGILLNNVNVQSADYRYSSGYYGSYSSYDDTEQVG